MSCRISVEPNLSGTPIRTKYYTARQLRVILLTLAGLLGCTAVFLRAASLLPFEAECAATGVLRTGLLPESISLYAVQALVAQPEFQRAAGVRIGVESVPTDGSSFQMTTYGATEAQVSEGFEEAVRFLKLKLKALALSELKASQAFVNELRDEAREADQLEPLDEETPASATSLAATSVEDRERITLLRKEIEGLVGFLRYSKRPEWLSARLDRKTLRKAESRVETARKHLLDLSEKWAPGSSAVKIQSKELQQSRRDLANLERHLGEALLRSHRAELKDLEAKQAASKTRVSVADPTPGLKSETEEQDWLAEHGRKLGERRLVLESKAKLSVVSGPVVQLNQSLGYWTSMGLWTGCLTALMGFLFVSPQKGQQQLRSVDLQASKESAGTPLPIGVPLPPGVAAVSGANLGVMLRKELGRDPVCLLVLGSDGASRSSLSLRLAQALGENSTRARLIDFDLSERPLSQRLGESNSPGISDLLSSSSAGAPEEFFASLPGTDIQFAAAGSLKALTVPAPNMGWRAIFRQPPAVSLVDASFASPIHLVIAEVDAVICQCQPGTRWTSEQSEVLDAIRVAKLPIWGVSNGDSRVFRFL